MAWKLSLQIRKVYEIECSHRLLMHFDTRTLLLGWCNWSSDVTYSTGIILYSYVNSYCKTEMNLLISPVLCWKQRIIWSKKYPNNSWHGGWLILMDGPQYTLANVNPDPYRHIPLVGHNGLASSIWVMQIYALVNWVILAPMRTARGFFDHLNENRQL